MKNKKVGWLLNRYVAMVLVGIIISLLLHVLVPENPHNKSKFGDFILSIVITFFAWEGNIRIDEFMNHKLPWEKSIWKRILVHFLATLFYSVFVIYLFLLIYDKYVCELPADRLNSVVNAAVLIGAMFSVFLMSVEISVQFFKKWKASLVDAEKYKQESIQAQLENLKNQVNPHFLFNNLSVLSSLVYKDQDKAVEFINQFSKVYRYLLENRSRELVELNEELTFANSYCFLLKIRFDAALQIHFQVDEQAKLKLLPPMALQILLENAIKHNEASVENPLHVDVESQGNLLIIRNNLQLRQQVESSSKTGINNILNRYKHFTTDKVKIEASTTHFIVQLPLLETKS